MSARTKALATSVAARRDSRADTSADASAVTSASTSADTSADTSTDSRANEPNDEHADPLAARYPLTLYFDDSCPLCRAEMAAIKRLDRHDRLHLVDCSVPGFDDAACAQARIPVEALMRRLHARDADGVWRVGVPAFAVAYAAIDALPVARFLAAPGRRSLLERAYGWLADHRQGFSRLGLNGLFGAYVHWVARRAARNAHACADGHCRLPPAN